MNRYDRAAAWYDVLAGEPFYRVGREQAISAMHLRKGSRVLDIGCGTGLNFPLLLDAVGSEGTVVGVDLSHGMLEVARRRTIDLPRGTVVLVEADAEHLHQLGGAVDALAAPFDAVICTYSLSLVADPWRAWQQAAALVRPGGRAAVVDMARPRGRGRLLDPAARLACWLGGADITASPWTLLEQSAHDVESWAFRGGHVQVRVATL